MDNMEFTVGIENTASADDQTPDNVIPFETKTRPVWVDWVVGGTTYKLKLTSDAIVKLEGKYKKNLLTLIMEDSLPPLVVVLSITQAALQKFHHGIDSYKVQELFDQYLEEGGDQTAYLSKIIFPLLHSSGFFTDSQMEILTKEIEDIDSDL